LDQDTFARGFRQLFGYEKAGEEYLRIWNRLLLFFRDQSEPQELADEVMDRMIRKAAEEVEIAWRVQPYALAIARYVRLEHLKKAPVVTPYDVIQFARLKQEDASERETRLQALEECLEELPRSERTLILNYYAADKQERIEQRRQMAAELGIPLNALRVRVHRIHHVLKRAIERKLSAKENSRIT
jgi:DNA-directed RNA polymerase specialized sigma24 family protein